MRRVSRRAPIFSKFDGLAQEGAGGILALAEARRPSALQRLLSLAGLPSPAGLGRIAGVPTQQIFGSA
jgi:hypothetical protein